MSSTRSGGGTGGGPPTSSGIGLGALTQMQDVRLIQQDVMARLARSIEVYMKIVPNRDARNLGLLADVESPPRELITGKTILEAKIMAAVSPKWKKTLMGLHERLERLEDLYQKPIVVLHDLMKEIPSDKDLQILE